MKRACTHRAAAAAAVAAVSSTVRCRCEERPNTYLSCGVKVRKTLESRDCPLRTSRTETKTNKQPEPRSISRSTKDLALNDAHRIPSFLRVYIRIFLVTGRARRHQEKFEPPAAQVHTSRHVTRAFMSSQTRERSGLETPDTGHHTLHEHSSSRTSTTGGSIRRIRPKKLMCFVQISENKLPPVRLTICDVMLFVGTAVVCSVFVLVYFVPGMREFLPTPCCASDL